MALGGEKRWGFSGIGAVATLRGFRRGGRFSFTSSLISNDSIWKSLSREFSSGASIEVGVSSGAGEVGRKAGRRICGSW